MERYIVSFVAGLTTFILLYTFVDFNGVLGGVNLEMFLDIVFSAIVALAVSYELRK